MPFTDTRRLDEAADALGGSFPLVRLSTGDSARPFRLRFHRSDAGPLTLTRLAVDGELTTTGAYPDHIAVGRRHRGTVDIRYGGGALDTGGPYLRLPGESVARFVNSDVELLILRRDEFESVAERHLAGTGRRLRALEVAGSSPTTIAAGRLWHSVSATITSSLAEPTSPLRFETLHDLAVAALLACFALTDEVSTPNGPGYLPRAVARAVRFMDEHLAEPITVVDVAAAARMSVRGVQSAFRRELDISPMHYLRRIRLEAVQADLERLDPSTTTVTQTARRWGFGHPSRFASLYREQFGRSPSDVLRS